MLSWECPTGNLSLCAAVLWGWEQGWGWGQGCSWGSVLLGPGWLRAEPSAERLSQGLRPHQPSTDLCHWLQLFFHSSGEW